VEIAQMAHAKQEIADRVNILLPMPSDEGSSLLSGVDGEWGAGEYAEARIAAAALDERELSIEPAEYELARAVLQAVAGNADLRGAMTAAGVRTSGDEVDCISLADLDGVGPPHGMPFFIPEIGVLSVPAAADAVKSVEAAAKSVHPDVRAEPAIVYRVVSPLATAEAIGTTPVALPSDEVDAEEPAEWLEAALEVGTAAQLAPWGIARVNAPRAWARGFRGQGIRVAVVDTGVGPHLDLAPPVASATFVPGSTSANDDNGHGTHVAGTIAALDNATGVVGVAPRATLLRAKVLDRSGSGSDTQVAAGIVWAANNGARIINLSLGGGFSTAIQRALVFARGRRAAICAAAGNNSTPTRCAPAIYPARDPLCIAVAAIDAANRKAVFSCCGPELDLAAPGVNILSTFPGNAYRILNGTSMATPHVSGTAAVLLSRAPGLEPARLQAHLQRTALPLGATNRFGRGLVQADRAVTLPVLSATTAGAQRNGQIMDEGAAADDTGPRLGRPTARQPAQTVSGRP
jgi:subtilisin family serine protease